MQHVFTNGRCVMTNQQPLCSMQGFTPTTPVPSYLFEIPEKQFRLRPEKSLAIAFTNEENIKSWQSFLNNAENVPTFIPVIKSTYNTTPLNLGIWPFMSKSSFSPMISLIPPPLPLVETQQGQEFSQGDPLQREEPTVSFETQQGQKSPQGNPLEQEEPKVSVETGQGQESDLLKQIRQKKLREVPIVSSGPATTTTTTPATTTKTTTTATTRQEPGPAKNVAITNRPTAATSKLKQKLNKKLTELGNAEKNVAEIVKNAYNKAIEDTLNDDIFLSKLSPERLADFKSIIEKNEAIRQKREQLKTPQVKKDIQETSLINLAINTLKEGILELKSKIFNHMTFSERAALFLASGGVDSILNLDRNHFDRVENIVVSARTQMIIEKTQNYILKNAPHFTFAGTAQKLAIAMDDGKKKVESVSQDITVLQGQLESLKKIDTSAMEPEQKESILKNIDHTNIRIKSSEKEIEKTWDKFRKDSLILVWLLSDQELDAIIKDTLSEQEAGVIVETTNYDNDPLVEWDYDIRDIVNNQTITEQQLGKSPDYYREIEQYESLVKSSSTKFVAVQFQHEIKNRLRDASTIDYANAPWAESFRRNNPFRALKELQGKSLAEIRAFLLMDSPTAYLNVLLSDTLMKKKLISDAYAAKNSAALRQVMENLDAAVVSDIMFEVYSIPPPAKPKSTLFGKSSKGRRHTAVAFLNTDVTVPMSLLSVANPTVQLVRFASADDLLSANKSTIMRYYHQNDGVVELSDGRRLRYEWIVDAADANSQYILAGYLTAKKNQRHLLEPLIYACARRRVLKQLVDARDHILYLQDAYGNQVADVINSLRASVHHLLFDDDKRGRAKFLAALKNAIAVVNHHKHLDGIVKMLFQIIVAIRDEIASPELKEELDEIVKHLGEEH